MQGQFPPVRMPAASDDPSVNLANSRSVKFASQPSCQDNSLCDEKPKHVNKYHSVTNFTDQNILETPTVVRLSKKFRLAARYSIRSNKSAKRYKLQNLKNYVSFCFLFTCPHPTCHVPFINSLILRSFQTAL
jgi:hypothetical protein